MSGLAVNPLSYYSSYYPQKNATTAQAAFRNLGTALASGNLSSAQVAFTTLQQASQGNNQGGMNRAISADMANLGSALTASNLASAQSSFAQLNADVGAQRAPQLQPSQGSGGIAGVIQTLLSGLSPSSSTTTSGSSTSTVAPGALNVQA
jgi:hypothetical protein